MNFKLSLADADVWMWPAIKDSGQTYYEYVFVYVDDILVLSVNPQAIMNTLSILYRLKEGSVGPPTQYLGAQINPHHFKDMPGKCYWCLSAHHYIKKAIKNLEAVLKKAGKKLPSSRIVTPMASGNCPELDVSLLLDSEHIHFYQQQIGILQWTVELGHIDLCTSIALLAQYLVAPREGHLNPAYHIFAYLKAHD
jgi:hypothetical protein